MIKLENKDINDNKPAKKEGPLKKIEDLLQKNNDNLRAYFDELDKVEAKDKKED